MSPERAGEITGQILIIGIVIFVLYMIFKKSKAKGDEDIDFEILDELSEEDELK